MKTFDSPVASSTKPPSVWIWLFWLFVAAVYLGTTATLPLIGRDEPRYVQIGREMWQSGDWITPRLGGLNWFEKPVLLYWMVAAAFSAFGLSEWAARIGAASCGLGTALLVWNIARRVRTDWGFWSGASLAASVGFIAFSHAATFDIVLTFTITLAMWGFWRAQIEPDAKRANRFLSVLWIGVGLSLLAKGLVAFILPGGIIALFWLLRREKIRVGFWWGFPLSILVSLVWYGPVIWRNGMAFVDEFFVQHHFARYFSDKFQHSQPPYFYIPILLIATLPWTPFLFGALARLRPRLWRSSGETVVDEATRLRALALAWMIFPIAFFSVSGSKLPGYILPAIPGAFLLLGEPLANFARSAKPRFALATLLGIALLIPVFLSVGPGTKLADRLVYRENTREMFNVARAAGFGNVRVVQFKTLQRGAHFYAANQLVYGPDEEMLELRSVDEVARVANGKPLLVVANTAHLAELKTPKLRPRELAHNGRATLVIINEGR